MKLFHDWVPADRVETLPRDLKAPTLQILRELPDGDRLCHGDFYPYNIFIRPKEQFFYLP